MGMDTAINLGWWQLAGNRLSDRSVASEPKTREIGPHDNPPSRKMSKMHVQALYRRGNPNAKTKLN